MVSQIFEDAFADNVCGCRRTCVCGVVHYDAYNHYDWEDGELEALESDPETVGHDGTVGTMTINNEEIVIGCTCNKAQQYETFILGHARQVAKYLNAKAASMREVADLLEVKADKGA